MLYDLSLHELVRWVAVSGLFKLWLTSLPLTALAVVPLEFSTLKRFFLALMAQHLQRRCTEMMSSVGAIVAVVNQNRSRMKCLHKSDGQMGRAGNGLIISSCVSQLAQPGLPGPKKKSPTQILLKNPPKLSQSLKCPNTDA